MKSIRHWVGPNAFLAGILFGLPCVRAGVVCGAEELDALARAALAGNPRIQAARLRLDRAAIRQRERSGFFDPALTGSAGRSSAVRSTPGLSPLVTLPNDATVLNLGVETPIRPGFYFGLGAGERLFSEAGPNGEELYQTLVGARIRIPLLRDRGFRQYDEGVSEDVALWKQSASLLLAEAQSVLRDLDLAYLAARQSAALRGIAGQARERFEVLLRETEKLVELGVTASYQILPARMELDLRRAEENEAQQAYETSLIALANVVGVEGGVSVAGNAADLIEWAAAAPTNLWARVEDAWAARGSRQALLHGIEALEAALRRARDDLRSDLSIEAGATWQGESADDGFGRRRILSEDHVGADALVVLRRPLGFRAERSRAEEARARIDEWNEMARQEDIAIRAAMETARREFSMARGRLDMVSGAVASAERAVAAERERFRLGEGRSRNVLDAQKDLTGAIRRQAETAGAVLRAYGEFRYAAGLNAERFDMDGERHDARGGPTR